MYFICSKIKPSAYVMEVMKQFDTEEEAETYARERAQKKMNCEYFVLKPIKRVVSALPPVLVEDLR